MKLFNTVAIVGTGLIGGSIGLAIKKKKLAQRIVGISRHKKNLLRALQRGAIDKGSQTLGIVKGADLVILATPVKTILNLAPSIFKIVGKDSIVIDVGSTKKEIVGALEKFFPKFLGCHPLAGSEKRSIAYAQADIFKDSLCILTPTKKTNPKALNLVRIFWSNLGAKTVLLTPGAHDKILSFVSHLPHAVAFSLIDIIPKEYLRFASSGLKDTTRIASSDSELWADILLSNAKNIVKTITMLEHNLTRVSKAIRDKNRRQLIKILKQAKKKRDSL
jgi:prephenate dehydrogenase